MFYRSYLCFSISFSDYVTENWSVTTFAYTFYKMSDNIAMPVSTQNNSKDNALSMFFIYCV
jgi:hypothetical protein